MRLIPENTQGEDVRQDLAKERLGAGKTLRESCKKVIEHLGVSVTRSSYWTKSDLVDIGRVDYGIVALSNLRT